MSSEFDETDFIDRDFQAAQKAAYNPTAAAASTAAGATTTSVPGGRPPSREELETRVAETHTRLSELKRAQEALERERSALEEARRRRVELQTGREEMLEHLTRGVGLLEEAEFAARRDADQMAKTLVDFHAALAKVQAIHEETWTDENWNVELTRALTTIENARMEWNSARQKWTVLNGNAAAESATVAAGAGPLRQLLAGHTLADLCKIGLALTWPLAIVGLLALVMFLFLLLNR